MIIIIIKYGIIVIININICLLFPIALLTIPTSVSSKFASRLLPPRFEPGSLTSKMDTEDMRDGPSLSHMYRTEVRTA